MNAARRALWIAGAPARALLIGDDPRCTAPRSPAGSAASAASTHLLPLRGGGDPRARRGDRARRWRSGECCAATRSAKGGIDQCPPGGVARRMRTSHKRHRGRPDARRDARRLAPFQALLDAHRLGARLDLRRDPQLRGLDHHPDDPDPRGPAAARHQADQVDAGDAGDPAKGQGDPEEVQGQQAEGPGRDDEALPGGRREPARVAASRSSCSSRSSIAMYAVSVRPSLRRRSRMQRSRRYARSRTTTCPTTARCSRTSSAHEHLDFLSMNLQCSAAQAGTQAQLKDTKGQQSSRTARPRGRAGATRSAYTSIGDPELRQQRIPTRSPTSSCCRDDRHDLLSATTDAEGEPAGRPVLPAAGDPEDHAGDVRHLRLHLPRRPGRVLDHVQPVPDRPAGGPAAGRPHRAGRPRAADRRAEARAASQADKPEKKGSWPG